MSPQQATGSGNKVFLCNRQKKNAVCLKTLKHHFLAAMDTLEITDSEISLAIVSDKAIAVLHEKWLGISGPTDVLSFNLSSPKHAQSSGDGKQQASGNGKQQEIHGEIIASAETASREAHVYSWSPEYELLYYLIHGLLHLIGYDDQTPSARISIRRKERAVMRAIGLPTPPRRRPKTTCYER